MKIAVVSGMPVFPSNEGNRIRILNLTRAIRSLGHELYFIYLPRLKKSAETIDLQAHVDEYGDSNFRPLTRSPIKDHLLHGDIWPKLKRKFLNFINHKDKYYFHLDEYHAHSWGDQLRKIDEEINFDVVVTEYAFYSKAFLSFPSTTLKILDTHDSFADRHKLFIGKYKLDQYWFSMPVEEECRAFRRADIVVAIQDEEASVFERRLGSAPPAVAAVSHFLDLTRPVQDYAPTRALILGSANSANIVSLVSFIEHVLPLVVDRVPEFKLVLAGGICGAVPDHANIVKLGLVDHVSDAFREAPLSINPTLVGTGINIKLLDAMASAVATVSTETGARGLPQQFRGGVTTVPDDDPKCFADAIIALAQSRDLRAAGGRSAYEAAQAWNEKQIASLKSILVKKAV